MGSGRWGWIVPDGLWELARPLLPPARVRPQGGGVANIDDEAVFAAIIYVLVSGCAWRALPPCFGASKSTVHRRFAIWSRAGVWGRLHQKVLQLLDEEGLVDLSRAVLDSAHVRAKKGANTQVRAPWTGASQVPGCMSCPTRTDCPYASGSPRPTPTTARP
ncbi:IS5 family transposase [Streptomyces phaeoluteigriseus]|uniref:IS5 family transposase n=1 Tax=Streptomyces phaeoluteigriseus TaxID=114686 RepID=A0A1V6MUR1_9ACTN|nr:IS5 family transposase [Streptomyces phaeoluteigriseus]